MNRAIFESILQRPPDTEEKSYIFIVGNQQLAENIFSSGFISVLIKSGKEGYISSTGELEEVLSGMALGFHAEDYIFVPCLSKKDNESLQEWLEDESLQFRDDGWKIFRKSFFRRPEAAEKTKTAIQNYINDYKIPLSRADLKTEMPLQEGKPLTEEEAILLSQSHPLDLRTNRFDKVTNDFINYTDIVEHDAYLKGKISYDLMALRPMVKGVFWNLDAHPITDNDYSNIRRYMSLVYGVSNKTDCQQAVNLAARKNSYHPVRQFFDGLKWDGVPRIPDLFPVFLGATKGKYTTAFTEAVLSSIIERVYIPGTKQDICYILADTNQGGGKSTMCRYLALKDEYFTDALKDFKDQDKAFEKIQGMAICELGEMLATRKAENIESIKAYLSQVSDDYRTPYNVCKERYLRQVTFIGTSNRPSFLPFDQTGNRRFIPLMCNKNKAELHPVEHEKEARQFIIDCYAEMLQRRKEQGHLSVTFPYDLQAEVAELQEMSAPEDSRIGMIQNYLDDCKENVVCSRLIWDSVFSDPDRPVMPKKIDLLDIADIMNLSIEGWQRYRGKDGTSKTGKCRFADYGSQRAWERIVSSDSASVDTGTGTGGHGTEESEGFIDIPDTEDLPFV